MKRRGGNVKIEGSERKERGGEIIKNNVMVTLTVLFRLQIVQILFWVFWTNFTRTLGGGGGGGGG